MKNIGKRQFRYIKKLLCVQNILFATTNSVSVMSNLYASIKNVDFFYRNDNLQFLQIQKISGVF